MKKTTLWISCLVVFLFGSTGKCYAYTKLFEKEFSYNGSSYLVVDRENGTDNYDETFEGYLWDSDNQNNAAWTEWSGYYIGTMTNTGNGGANVSDDGGILEVLLTEYLDDEVTITDFKKVENPDDDQNDTTSGTDDWLSVTWSDDGKSGTWSTDDPFELGFYAVKAATEFSLYFVFPYKQYGKWSTVHLIHNGVTGNNIVKSSNEDQTPEFSHVSAVPNAIPEPATLLLFGAGLISLGAIGRRKFKDA